MYDIMEGNQFIMVMPGKEIMFNGIHNVLYYHDPEERDLVPVNTMEENREGFYHIDLSEVREAKHALVMFGYPSQKTFEHMVCTINNCPITIEDVCNDNIIYGFNITTLKGKTVRQQPNHVQSENIEVP